MKVAFVTAKYPYGTQESYFDVELRAIAPYLTHVGVFPTSPPPGRPSFENVPASVTRRDLSSLRTIVEAVSAFVEAPKTCLAAIVSLVREPYRPRVKLKNLAVVPLGLALGRQFRREGYEHVHAYWLSTPASVAYLAARVARVPWSTTAHQWDIYEANALRTKLSSARFVRAISARGRDDLLALARLPAAPVRVVHVGVDVPAAAATIPAVTGRPFTMLCAANLVAKKGHTVLLEALAEVRRRGVPVRCDLAGDGELRAMLEATAARLDVRDVRFRGHVAHDPLLGEIRGGAYDALVLASIEREGGLMEGIPVIVMEAMSLGLPVIVTDSGSMSELVDDTCGTVVAQGDPQRLADAIVRTSLDVAGRAARARAGYDRVRESFDVSTIAREIASLVAASHETLSGR